MTVTLTGIYIKGTLRLLDAPDDLPEGLVRVTLDARPSPGEPRYLQPGKYGGESTSTLEDFRITEWHGDNDLDELP